MKYYLCSASFPDRNASTALEVPMTESGMPGNTVSQAWPGISVQAMPNAFSTSTATADLASNALHSNWPLLPSRAAAAPFQSPEVAAGLSSKGLASAQSLLTSQDLPAALHSHLPQSSESQADAMLGAQQKIAAGEGWVHPTRALGSEEAFGMDLGHWRTQGNAVQSGSMQENQVTKFL